MCQELTSELLFHSLCDGNGLLVELLWLVVLRLLTYRTREHSSVTCRIGLLSNRLQDRTQKNSEVSGHAVKKCHSDNIRDTYFPTLSELVTMLQRERESVCVCVCVCVCV